MNKIQEKILALKNKFKKWYKTLPDSKKYVELLTAVLSIPVMVTVIIINLNNLNQNKQTQNTKTTPASIQVVISAPVQKQPDTKQPPNFNNNSLTPTNIPIPTITPTPTSTECKKEVGPIEITSPQEGQVITKNNLCIKYTTNSEYCSVETSYQLDNGSWSDSTESSICLYNISAGDHVLELKIKSTKSEDTITLKRNFSYQETITPTVTPTN